MTSENMEAEPDPAATRLQPAGDTPILPVLRIDAHERAPTLMAGATAGRHGKVKIWKPQRRLIWGHIVVVILCALFALLFIAQTGGRDSIFGTIFIIFTTLGIIPVCTGVKDLRAPATYLSADDNGLAFSTAKGSRALRWDDLASMRELPADPGRWPFQLVLKSGERVEIDLTSYTDRSRRQVLSLLVSKLTRRILFGDPSVISKCWVPNLGGRCGAPAHLVDQRRGYAVCNHHAKPGTVTRWGRCREDEQRRTKDGERARRRESENFMLDSSLIVHPFRRLARTSG